MLPHDTSIWMAHSVSNFRSYFKNYYHTHNIIMYVSVPDLFIIAVLCRTVAMLNTVMAPALKCLCDLIDLGFWRSNQATPKHLIATGHHSPALDNFKWPEIDYDTCSCFIEYTEVLWFTCLALSECKFAWNFSSVGMFHDIISTHKMLACPKTVLLHLTI